MIWLLALSCSLFSTEQDDMAADKAVVDNADAEALQELRFVVHGRRAIAEAPYADAVSWGRPLAGELLMFVAADKGDAIGLLSPEQIAAYGLDTEALEATAKENMRKTLLPLRYEVFKGMRLWALDTSDGRVATDSYGAARLVLHEAWGDVRQTVKGDLLVAAPARDAVIFTGSEEAEMVDGIQKLAQAMFEGEENPVSPQVFRWTEAGWELFESKE